MNATNSLYDVFVVGGGINGVGIANDAAGRGLNVMLCEMNDLASATSSASSKLIHGGLRYLEYYEFGLVKKALAEREILLKNAPHIISPLVFRLPHQRHLRPAWMIRAGLFLYDNLAKRLTLPKSRSIEFSVEDPLKADIKKGFEYADAWVDDARLVVLNACAARANGATIVTQTKLINAESVDDIWQLTLLDKASGKTFKVHSKTLVNAAGPWLETLTKQVDQTNSQAIRLVKGSHIVVPKLHDDPHAYILQNEDQRIVFVLPFEQDFSLIGTTDVDYDEDPQQAKISSAEIDYLISITNSYFTKQIAKHDIVHSFAGVRPLLHDEAEDAKAVTRDFTIDLSTQGHPPLLNIYGGKITTYRVLAEAALDKLQRYFPNMRDAWTKHAPLPGGNFDSRLTLSARLAEEFPWLEQTLRQRYVRCYGTLSYQLLENCHSLADLGQHFGGGLYHQELCYLVKYEWATSTEDVIWRRTKLGLSLTKEQVQKIDNYFASKSDKELAHQCCA